MQNKVNTWTLSHFAISIIQSTACETQQLYCTVNVLL